MEKNMKRLYNRMCAYAQSLSRVQLLATLWTVAHQAPLSMGFPRLEHWIGLPFPSSGVLPNPGIEPMSPGLAGRFFIIAPHTSKHLLTSYVSGAQRAKENKE